MQEGGTSPAGLDWLDHFRRSSNEYSKVVRMRIYIIRTCESKWCSTEAGGHTGFNLSSKLRVLCTRALIKKHNHMLDCAAAFNKFPCLLEFCFTKLDTFLALY